MFKNKNFYSILGVGLLAFLLTACSSSDPIANGEEDKDETPKFLNIGTAGTGGAYYPVGIAIADILGNQLNLSATAQVTGGALENVSLIQSKEVDIAITQSPMAVAGYNGTEPFKQKNENVATLFNGISQGVFQLVVLDSSGINSIADLKGKKVVLGPAGGGAINVVTDLLGVYDLTIADITPTYVSYSEGVSMLSDNNVDAVIIQAAAPSPAITELAATTKGYKLITIEPEKMEQLLSKFSYLNQIDLPSDMYGTKEDITTVYLTNMMVVRKDLNEEFIYNLTKAIFENLEKVQKSHPSAVGLTLESQGTPAPIPLHPGAEKYFKEEGILK
ncbi:TAXI family TRAP transporter solute-binding subunit [Paenisporosarcina antarctica]|uniref:TAXI family TRAP transporter solute-binding subunit n=1 Tax=Paenisporosarcina antarctica TaxID=417367 RepID=A0A4P7A2B3_9BACL|nr:TAXI family TRAP transporter solute-binding subunit [Paenisporosarcina antarctica]QBP43190.1 TAXI family TRAP transporter solute-binding subunit [Paenisporosarcina antarctica]